MDFSEQRGEKPVRISAAIDLDLSKVVEETTRRVQAKMAQTVAEVVMPALAEINQNVETLAGLMFPAGWVAMSDADAVATLTAMLPGGTPMPVEVAGFQHERLTEAGYAVVPVAGAALKHAISVAQHRQRLAEQERRADARLAQATADPLNDSWHEPKEGHAL